MIGQALFLVVFTVLVAGATRWGAHDVRQKGQLSELASLSLGLLAFLGILVFVLALSSAAGSSGLPLAARLPVGLLLAIAGLVLVLRGEHVRHPFARVLGSPLRVGVAMLAVGTATIFDSGVALLLILLGVAATRAIWPSAQEP